MDAKEIAKRIDVRHNVSLKVIDKTTGATVSEHTGHNASTNSLLTGIAHYLTGDGVLGQSNALSLWVPRYISLGTMGLINQDEDENGYPAGIGVVGGVSEPQRYFEYMNQCPGFGADGYDANLNNNRSQLGLGPMFADREVEISTTEIVQLGDLDGDGEVTNNDLIVLMGYVSGISSLTDKQKFVADVTEDGEVDADDVQLVKGYLDGNPECVLPKREYKVYRNPAINCELVSLSYPRASITFRDIVPESQAEYPKTLDVVFSAFVSTGALNSFRESGKDFVFITEAGLWSRPDWTSGGDNGLLAGYRIAPPDESNWPMAIYNKTTGTYQDSPECALNREILRKNIIKVGINQVVQVIWKIQIGGIEQLGGIEKLYPQDTRLKWIVWE